MFVGLSRATPQGPSTGSATSSPGGIVTTGDRADVTVIGAGPAGVFAALRSGNFGRQLAQRRRYRLDQRRSLSRGSRPSACHRHP